MGFNATVSVHSPPHINTSIQWSASKESGLFLDKHTEIYILSISKEKRGHELRV